MKPILIKNICAGWQMYLLGWIMFGLIGGALQPVIDNLDTYPQQKLFQEMNGMLFGFICFVVFTPLQNWFNTPRVRWKSWLIVIGTWMGVKFLYLITLITLGVI